MKFRVIMSNCCNTTSAFTNGVSNGLYNTITVKSVREAAACAEANCASSATNATNAANSAAAAAASETNVENLWEDFQERYMGPYATPPVAISEGSLYYNTTSNVLFVWNGSAWVSADFNEFTNFTATGTTTARNLVTRMADVVNVKDFGAVGDGIANDTAALQAAINYCNTNSKSLFWPDGEYLTTSSISNLHNIKNIGTGVIVRTNNSNKFYISNKDTLVNKFYVSVSGNDNNDGLSSSQPVATLQKAINNLQSYTLTGAWEINLAAGTYSTSANRVAEIGWDFWPANIPNSTAYTTKGINANNYITIQGPDVGYDPSTNSRPNPTAIFDGGNAALIGITCRNVNVIFRNLKFIDYSGSSSSAGISAAASNIRTINVHTSNCYYGISSANGRLELYGGSIYGNLTKSNTYGIRSILLNYHSIGRQNAGTTSEGPLISFCTQGALIQENSTGHFDYCSIEDNTVGLRITNSSRVNCTGTNFKRNAQAVRADFDSNVFYDNNTIFNTGTADQNTENIVTQTFSCDIVRSAYGNSGLGTDYLTSPDTITGTLSSTSIITKVLEQGTFAPVITSIRKPQQIKFIAYGTITGTGGAKQFKIRLGTTILASIINTATDTSGWVCEGYITFTSPTTQSAMMSYYSHSGTQKVNIDTGTEDMNSSNKTLTFEVQLTDSADSVTVTHAQFEEWG